MGAGFRLWRGSERADRAAKHNDTGGSRQLLKEKIMTAPVACSKAAPLVDAAVIIVLDGHTPAPVVRSLLVAGVLLGQFGATVGTYVSGRVVPRGFSDPFYKR